MKKTEKETQATANHPPIIIKDAIERAMGDVELIQMLFDELKATVWNHMEKIKDALDRGDNNALEKEAHQLKGAAASLSVTGVAAKAFDLERMGKGDLEINSDAISDLEGEIKRFIDYIDNFDWGGI